MIQKQFQKKFKKNQVIFNLFLDKRVDHQNKIKKIQEEYALCLSNPDWLVEVPDDLCGVEDSILGMFNT